MTQEKIKLYGAEECAPCVDLQDALATNRHEVLGVDGETPEIEHVDLMADENAHVFEEVDINAVPIAYYEGRQCQIRISDETGKVIFDCRDESEWVPEKPEELEAQ